MLIRSLSLAVLVFLPANSNPAASAPQALIIWPGYTFEMPAGFCVRQENGPDFHVLYVQDKTPKHVNLVGIYAGHAPNFEPDCVDPSDRTSTVQGLTVRAVRGKDSCADFLIEDPKNDQRGSLDVWFCPGAKQHPAEAEALVASIRPAAMPFEASDLPPCE